MNKIAQIIPIQHIPISQNQVYSYLVPKSLQEKIKIGQEVKIPLRNQFAKGVVFSLKPERPKFKLKEIIEIIDEIPSLSEKQFQLAKWMMDYYYTSLGLIVKLFLPKRVKRLGKYLTKKYEIKPTKFPKLTEEQNQAYQKTMASPPKSVILLHGVTGSGKTEIYLAAIREVLKQDKQIMVLVPEIALTPQTIIRFMARFGENNCVVIHSKLSNTERFLAWQKIRENKAKIVIGPRSIVFAPYFNLGLVIIDEEHDSSYKSYDQTPKYHARDTAIELAKNFGAKVILGSATPVLESYYKAKNNEYILCELSHRFFSKNQMPKTEIIDMKEEAKKKNISLFSEQLKEEVKKTINNKRQVILFLNRRGTATFIICRDCGYVIKCKKCDVPMILHSKAKIGKKTIYAQDLVCHHCNETQNIMLLCQKCGSHQIKFYGSGTEKVEMEIKDFLPKIKFRRVDTDSMNKKFVHQKAYFDFLNKKYNLLIGTQMIAKGWDIPAVDLIGIILADTVLNLPDFRSSEKTFQLITQVSGRTGRRDNPGSVILQTYHPENPVIQAAAKHDYKSFFDMEIKQRKDLNYPPFSRLIKITFHHKNKQKAKEKITELAKEIKSSIFNLQSSISMLGPAPAFIPKIRNFYIWHLVLKFVKFDAKMRNEVLRLIPPGFGVDVDPESLL